MDKATAANGLVGITLAGGYYLREQVSRGGLTEVFRATRGEDKKGVIVKVLDPLYASLPHLVARLHREAELTQRLGAVVPQVLGSGAIHGRPWIALEELAGETLSVRLKRGALPAREAVHIGLDALASLERLHQAGVLHNDLKPSHIMLVEGGVKFLDLDLAVSLTDTSRDDAAGTPAYLAPERIEGAAATVASDLYAVGLILFEMLAGRRAFVGDPVAMQRARTTEDAPLLSSLLPLVSPALSAVVTRALAHKPSDRFSSAAAMRSALGLAPEIS